MPAPKNNTYAKKPPGSHSTARIMLNLTPSQKALCERAADGERLTAWGKRVLLETANNERK